MNDNQKDQYEHYNVLIFFAVLFNQVKNLLKSNIAVFTPCQNRKRIISEHKNSF
jgi:hypothetical protein